MSENVVAMVPQPAQGAMPEGTVKITLAGQEWPIPKLAVRQWRVVVPRTFKLLRELGPMFSTILANRDSGDKMALAQSLTMTESQIDDLSAIIHAALRRAHPNMTLEQFDSLEMDIHEMMAALPIIMAQAGLFQKQQAATRTSLMPGEARAES